MTQDQDISPPPPLDPVRRTQLANERTFLAWWRTGFTAIAAGVAVAQVVPELADSDTQWPYSVVGITLALIGAVCMGYGELRRISVARALSRGERSEPNTTLTAAIAIIGVVTALAVVVLIAINS